ncbi:MAG: hypothetical protein IJ676_00915, partial [Clostridia bacterium]|nr:hypothetical protein [Clostridia bacterium]
MKKSLNKSVVLLFALALVLAVVLAIVPTMFGETASEKAHADGTTVDLSTLTEAYTAQDGEILTGTLGGNYKITIANGATVTLDTVTINCNNDAGITCNGDATIVLEGTNSVRSSTIYCAGIFVPEGKTLTIKGSGLLTVRGADYGAGIGGNQEKNCGTIVIESGTINAYGGEACAAIGSGNEASCEDIEIKGGTVTAIGGVGAAGIGAGGYGQCRTITISGGKIYAEGTMDETYELGGAGIGGGYGESYLEYITITGGNITAKGGYKAAAIGTGPDEDDAHNLCNEVKITDGVGKLSLTKGSDSPCTVGNGGNGAECYIVSVLGGGAVTESPYNYLAPGPAGVIVLIDEIPNPVVVNNACRNAIAAARAA